jgi:hypothetical protein
MGSIIHNVRLTNRGQLIIREFRGTIGLNDLLIVWGDIVAASYSSSHPIRVLNDLSSCEVEMTRTEFKQLMEYLRNEERLRHLRIAVVTNIPKNAVFAHIAEHTIQNLRIRLFSTHKAAEFWLMN